MKNRAGILGGGVAGIAAALALAKQTDTTVELIEKRPALGGLLQSHKVDNAEFDIGTFLFPSAGGIQTVLPGVAKEFTIVSPTLARITPKNTIDAFPFTARCFLRDNGLGPTFLAFAGILAASVANHPTESDCRGWITSRIGKRFLQDSGLDSYLIRLFHRDPGQIGAEFANQRLTNLNFSLSAAVKRRRPRISGTSLVRPPGGFARVFGFASEVLNAARVRVTTSAAVSRIESDGPRVLITVDGIPRSYSLIISTVSPEDVFRLLGHAPRAAYEHMDLVSLFYRGSVSFPGDILMNYSRSGMWKRITVLSRLYRSHENEERLVAEITVRRGSPLDIPHLRKDFETHIRSLGLVRSLSYVGHVITPNAYPVFPTDQGDLRKADVQTLAGHRIYVAGRQGTFSHFSSSMATDSAISTVQLLATHQST